MEALTIEKLREACKSGAAIRRVARLQPAGGEGDKVFPPTYEGGVYALEERVIEGRRVPCAILDSVQSQANRMESALLDAHKRERIRLPVVTVKLSAALPEVGDVTSLEAPHRLADAILRDSTLDGKPFRESPVGKVLDTATLVNATELFGICPTALVFGLWDSAGPRGGMGTKFPRTLVSEVIAVDAVAGVRPSSRLDPLGIQLGAGPVFEAAGGGWTLDEKKAAQTGGKPKKIGKEGKPSEINHGNVTPSLKSDKGQLHHGGVTIEHARQIAVLSLPALRRLRFPVKGAMAEDGRDAAAHVALAALGLAGLALSTAQGLDLRSRCLLAPEPGNPATYDVIGEDGGVTSFSLSAQAACELLARAIRDAKEAGLPWMADGIELTPNADLVELVRRSRDLATAAPAEG